VVISLVTALSYERSAIAATMPRKYQLTSPTRRTSPESASATMTLPAGYRLSGRLIGVGVQCVDCTSEPPGHFVVVEQVGEFAECSGCFGGDDVWVGCPIGS
jgi:hypothetical protein